MDLVPPLVVATVNVVAVHDRRQDELGLGLILTPLVFCNVLVVAVHAKRQEELGLRVHLDFDMDLLLCYETRRAWAWRSPCPLPSTGALATNHSSSAEHSKSISVFH